MTKSFSLDGKHLISSSGDKTAKLWDIATGREIMTLGHDNDLLAAFFSSDSTNVFSADDQGILRCWGIATGETTAKLNLKAQISHITYSTNRKFALFVDGIKLVYWDLVKRKPVTTVEMNESIVRDAAFSNDGNYIIMVVTGFSSPEMTLRILDVKKKKIIRIIQAGQSEAGQTEIRAVAISPNGKCILSGSGSSEKDARMSVWDATTGKLTKTFPFRYPVWTVAFSPDGNYAAAGTHGEVGLFETTTWEKRGTFKGSLPVAFSGDSGFLAYANTWSETNELAPSIFGIELLDLATGEIAKRFGGNAEYVKSAEFSSSGREIVAWGSRISHWDLDFVNRTSTVLLRATPSNTAIPDAVSPDSTYSVDFTDSVRRLWDNETGKIVHMLTADGPAPASKMCFNSTGQYLLAGMYDGSLALWDMENRVRLRIFAGKHKQAVESVAFSPDSKFAFSGSYGDDGTIKLWDVATGTLLKTYEGAEWVSSLAVSPDGKYLLSGGFSDQNNHVMLWNIATGMKVKVFKGRGLSSHVECVSFSHDGQYALSGTFDHFVIMWDIKSGKEVRTFKGHSGNIASVAFSPDDLRVISTSRDNTTRLWDVATGKELAQFISFTDGEWVAITPEGYYNASPNGDHYLNVRVGKSVYGIENYREAFFRPDLVKLAVSGGSLSNYQTLAEVKQPPKISIVQTPTSSLTEEFKLTLRLEEQGGGIGDVRLFLNGTVVMLDNGRGLKVVSKDDKGALYRSYILKLSPGNNTIRSIAFNADNSMQSNDVNYLVTASFASLHKPAMHALVIGIQEFRNPKLTLKYAVADANLFAETLQMGVSDLFGQVHVTTLTSREETTREEIISALQRFKTINPDDLFILYIASHGTVDEGEYFMITSNVGAVSTQRLKSDALSQVQIKELVANIPSTKKLIVIDTCNAAALGDAIQSAMLSRGMSEDTAMKILSRAVGPTILSASTSVQEALEGYQGHGLFTWVITQGMRGRADKGGSGFVKTTDLAGYVEDEVPNLAEQVFKRHQFPTVSISGQGFPIAKVR